MMYMDSISEVDEEEIQECNRSNEDKQSGASEDGTKISEEEVARPLEVGASKENRSDNRIHVDETKEREELDGQDGKGKGEDGQFCRKEQEGERRRRAQGETNKVIEQLMKLRLKHKQTPPEEVEDREGKGKRAWGGKEGAQKDVISTEQTGHKDIMTLQEMDTMEEEGKEDNPHTYNKEKNNVPSGDMGLVVEEPEVWENLALSICQQEMGRDKYMKRMAKHDKKHSSGLGSKTRLTYQMSRVKKAVTSSSTGVQHYNAIGAVGYAVVRPDKRLPEDRFFTHGKRFRVRLRHCAVRCEDDAGSCVRQAALKLADQNEDGPLDLVLFTGRAALARNAKTFLQALQARTEDAVREACHKDPKYCYALVDALRRAPSSYSSLRYHSQLAYLFTPKDDKPRVAKFRLVPFNDNDKETGLLETEDQHTPWCASRSKKDKRSMDYLRKGFVKQLEDSPVRYKLQIQVRSICTTSPNEDNELWNPQNLWDESDFPWLDLMELIFTTPLPQTATNRTAFNVVNRPKCLNFLPPNSVWDYKSYHTSCSSMYTTMELKEMNQINADFTPSADDKNKICYVVNLCTGVPGKGMPKVDVLMTLTGVSGRTAAVRLDKRIDGSDDDDEERHFRIQVDDVGDVLSITLGVRHRQVTADWMLHSVSLTNVTSGDVRFFPCFRVVLSKVVLRPGNVCLPNYEIHEVVRQERALEIRDRQQDYTWRKLDGLPSTIRAYLTRDLPPEQRLLAEKYAGLPWDLEFTMEEVSRHVTNVCQSPTSSQRAPLYGRQLSSRSVTEEEDVMGMGRRRSMAAFQSLPTRKTSMVLRRASSTSNTGAQKKWSKLKLAISFIACAAAKIPAGVKGEMCKACLDDVDVGRLFTQGSNPTMLHRIIRVPDKMAVNDAMMDPLMERDLTFTQEMQAGRVFLADYALLDDIPLYNKDGVSRYCAAPLAILYVNTSGYLVPLAIQLYQTPGDDNPVWLATDCADGWLLAKLWVRFADSINQFATHMFYCHLAVEPFAVATMRQLSESHPVYKLLKPHFRYLLVGNTLMRMHVCSKGGALDRWTSVGCEGNRAMMARLYETFHLDQLDFMEDLRRRGVHNNKKLTNYYFRDDGIKLWNAVSQYCTNLVQHFYNDDQDVVNDCEIQSWLRDIRENGFTGKADDIGLPVAFSEITQLSSLMTKIVFTVTCRHAATHSEAMDMYGHDAAVPATMRQPPPVDKSKVGKDLTVETLPDQKPDLYNTAMAYIMSLKRANPSALGQSLETYFVESEAKEAHNNFRKQLAFASKIIKKRNENLDHPYETLLPENIPNSVEPLPFLPGAEPEVNGVFTSDCERRTSGGQRAVPILAMPICMTFAKSVGGKSALGRRLSVNMFSQAMSGLNVERCNVPMNAKERFYGYGLDRATSRYQDQPY